MDYRQLGNSGLYVSTLSLGTVAFGGRGYYARLGTCTPTEAAALIDHALDEGVNLIDTADVYSDGLSEEIVGNAIKDKRDKVLLATKAGQRAGDGPNAIGASRLHLIRSCEQSLRRLQTDYIDLYQLHGWDGRTPLDETSDALNSLITQGKVRYIGASNFAGWQLVKALSISARLQHHQFISHQIYYSLESRDAEYELLPSAVDNNLGVLVWSPLAGGLLSGKYSRDTPLPVNSRHSSYWHEPPVRDYDRLYTIIDSVREIASAHDVSGAQVALAWLLTRPAIASLIIGIRTAAQLIDNLSAVALQLSDDEVSRLDVLSRPELIYPYWHQHANSAERFSAADLALHRR